VRSTVLAGARSFLAGALSFGLLSLPTFGASERALGVVVTANHAKLDNASASTGADVFSGDQLVTQGGGSMRLSLGPSQIYLLADSSATVDPDGSRVQARINIGTMGFSTSTPAQLEISTPLGMIRGADSSPIFGRVVVVSARKMRVSSYEGTLVVTDETGERKVIAKGETYEATAAGDADPPGADNPPAKGVTGTGVNWAHVLDVAIPLTVAGVVACAAWSVSPSGTGCWNQ